MPYATDSVKRTPEFGRAGADREQDVRNRGERLPTDAQDIGKLASTFAHHLKVQAECLPDGPPRAWLLGLLCLTKAVAATAAELESEP